MTHAARIKQALALLDVDRQHALHLLRQLGVRDSDIPVLKRQQPR